MNTLKLVKDLKVGLNFGDGVYPVGRLAIHKHQIYFEYDQNFIGYGLEISPFHLSLGSGVRRFNTPHFGGLPGVLYDCLPDGWGRLLIDRFVQSKDFFPSELSPLDKLAFVGIHGLGGLVFEPEKHIDCPHGEISLDTVFTHTQEILEGRSNNVLEELIVLNGSSAGARAKALIGLDDSRSHVKHPDANFPTGFSPWIVKFPNTQDGMDAGAIEYVYALMAKEAGIKMPDVHLFPAKKGAGYFAIKRFDKDAQTRFHMHSACGLLHSDFRVPTLDYQDLISLTWMLTKDFRDVERMFRLAVFNVLACNRDDHAKNFSFLMDKKGTWNLSPAYDLTFSSGPGGEQSTLVLGEGLNPTVEHLVRLGEKASINNHLIPEIIDQTQTSLSKWSETARKFGVSRKKINSIKKKMKV